MLTEPIHDREFVKCLCTIVSSAGYSPIINNQFNLRYGNCSIISSHDLGWENLSIPRCSGKVDFEHVYKLIRQHDKIFPQDMFFLDSGYTHLKAITSLNSGASFVTVKVNNSDNFDSIILGKRQNTLDCSVVVRCCEMLSSFPVVSAYFNLFLKMMCMLTALNPGKVTFLIAAPYIHIGQEEDVRNVYFKFNGAEFFKSCDKNITVNVSDIVISKNNAIQNQNKISKWELSELAKVDNLVKPNYFEFV